MRFPLTTIAAALSLTACATPTLTHPTEPAISAMVDNGGFYLSAQDYAYELQKGVPANLFVLTPNGYFLSKINEIQVAELLDEKRNSGVWK